LQILVVIPEPPAVSSRAESGIQLSLRTAEELDYSRHPGARPTGHRLCRCSLRHPASAFRLRRFAPAPE